jgi:signal transduction histidine kinase
VNKISFKLGLYFFIFTVLIETILFFYLYFGLVHTRIQEEFSELRSRGNSHRDVLVKHYNQETIAHVALMESEADTDVTITSQNGKILKYSNELTNVMKIDIEKEKGNIPIKGRIVENRWKTAPVISTVSPIIIHKQLKGYVYMFKNTNSIHEMIANLKHHFLIVGGFSLIITILTMFFLSKFITNPLIRMKRATEKLSKGDFSVSLDIKSQDELGELASSIQRLSRDLQHLKLERNEFLASISHELRTPLTYIKGYSEIISKRNNLNEQEKQKYLAIINEEAGHLTKLVKDLFELAKMDEHLFSIQKELINLRPFIKNVIGKLKPAFDDKKIVLINKCTENIFVSIDPNRFEQVITNLLDNALKYSDSHSKVVLEVQEKETNIVIKVMDEGIGIPESDLPYIFDRLYRVEKSRSRESGGSGLGLAIAREIINAHGGTLEVESILGEGTQMIITLERKVKNG